ncbi:hypothetical protein EIP91_006011 [Steccherinum ochraceum]|uniref:Aminoglycoside phosphotransferase domain-containing protein n=1 Tax=Steccherinum ochraceum TaxID=92696 RepID=A0A4R0RL99_9APHY|nr:hypothetical protein EIP91_006011 [Steccherinum ochraceum]
MSASSPSLPKGSLAEKYLHMPWQPVDAGNRKVFRLERGGLIMKITERLESTEADALRFLNQQLPTLPIPQLISSFVYAGKTHTIMTELKGTRLCDSMLRDKESLQRIFEQIQHCLRQLASVQRPPGDRRVLQSASGDGLLHPCFPDDGLCGPYDTTIDFYKSLFGLPDPHTLSALAGGTDKVEAIIARDCVIWVHRDLRSHNVLVHNGQLSGLIDWEDCGWFPAHWQLWVLRSDGFPPDRAWSEYWRALQFKDDSETAYKTLYDLCRQIRIVPGH